MRYIYVGIFFLVLLAGCTQPESNTQTNTEKTYSLQEIAKHNTESDCWMSVHGKVYNVTSYVSSHPGGKAILFGCGKNATGMFEKRKDNTSHSQNARDILKNYYIGDLK